MELILKNGLPTESLKNYSEEWDWVKRWMEGDSTFTFHSSGTTGKAKEIIFTRQQIERSTFRTADFFHWQEGMEVLHSLPMQYVAGRMNILRAVISKQTVWKMIPAVKFEAKDFRSLDKVEWWTLTPPMLGAFLSLDESILPNAKLLVGGAPVQQSLIKRAQAVKNEIWESYGAAETLTHIALRKLNGMDRTMGFKPVQGVHLELSDQGIVIDDNVLEHRVVTSDLGNWIGENEFVVEGRIDDIINSGGVKINPLEVEKIIQNYMQDSGFVKASPDEKWGQIVTWVIQKETVIPDNWQDWFASTPRLKPKLILRVDELPRNENGKWIRK